MLKLTSSNRDGDEQRRARVRRVLAECRRAPGGRETRSFRGKVRAAGREIYGTAAVFNTRTDIGPGLWLEQIQAGAFSRSIRERRNVACLVNHDPSMVLGRTANSSLTLRESSAGLEFSCDVSATSFGDDLLQLARRGDIGECSFGFTVPIGGDRWETMTDAQGRTRDLRTLLDVDLYDVSAVTFAQYSGTSVQTGRDILDGEDEPCECGDPDCDDPDCVERSRMIPASAGRAQLELRSRISRAPISDAEWEARARARAALALLEDL